MNNRLTTTLLISFLQAVIFCQSLNAEILIQCNFKTKFRVELDKNSKPGESSIREHSIVWHSVKKKYYLLADVIPLSHPLHPNTYQTEIHLWSSMNLSHWKYHGVAVTMGKKRNDFDLYGASTPAGAAFFQGKIFVPYSARRTEKFRKRSIGLAWSSGNPEEIPWKKSSTPISDLEGEDDDPALISLGDNKEIHLYHRIAGPDGYQIVHCQSNQPRASNSWSHAVPAVVRPDTVRAQELTGVVVINKTIHMFVIEHLYKKGIRIAHLSSKQPEGPFVPIKNQSRYIPKSSQPENIIYSGHITPVSQNGELKAFFWTVKQTGKRYGLLGHPVSTK